MKKDVLEFPLGRGNRRDFMSVLCASVDKNMIDNVGGGRACVPKETTGKEGISGSGKNLAQGNLSRIYKHDPS